MFDGDLFRNLSLIEEREFYENNFIQIEDIKKSDELDYYGHYKYEEYLEDNFKPFNYYDEPMEEFDDGFDFEDYLSKFRDEELIEQREAYELTYFSKQSLEPVRNDLIDFQIKSYEHYMEFDYGYEDYFESQEHYYSESYCCGDHFLDYLPNDNDSFDKLDYIDYPEGPDENLWGIKYPEIYYPDDFYDFPEPETNMDEEIEIDFHLSQEYKIDVLIEQRLKEEKQFIRYIANHEFLDEYLPPDALCDEIILLN